MNKNKVLVLLSTFNGEKYLRDQLDSLLLQKGVEIEVLIRDDGSKDSTIDILSDYKTNSRINFYKGDNLKSANSFLDLIKNASVSDYYAFCDQDDIWDDDKLKVAIDMLSQSDENKPSIYISNTELVDSALNYIGVSQLNDSISFPTSLIRNSATGCTMVFNKKLMEYLKLYMPSKIWMHDAWAFQLCLALDGNVCFDKLPHIKYRQHSNNVVGGVESKMDKLKRRYKSFFGQNKGQRYSNIIELKNGYCNIIPKHNLEIIEGLFEYKNGIKNKLKVIFNPKFKIKSLTGRIGFIIAIIFDKY